ncbi:RNA polymerase sigma-70 factor, ECF subfamily [Chitinophaga sp. CF118]|uniref:RNA polymerase sigma factor n=1 Tax=Chitinophaga sp. CF118 TaxID=1884367 RepID=UPI0008E28DE8|nr:RNA polymerase sigma-70 factor [Chitinophaga sp. CF118]SFE50109.1 RNA polymerase sigma-70 factor, ECF subfamily [Chitinophaga sp. CF118]
MSSRHSDYELIRMLIEGDATAFAELYELYRDKIFSFAFILTKSSSTAEEVVQEVFLKLWDRRDQIDINQSFTAYIRKITYHQVITFFRKAKRDRTLQQQLYDNMTALQQVSPDHLMEKQLQKAYHDAIRQLPPQKQKIYLLSRDEDLSYEEIASKMGISKNTVRNHMAEAISFIRRYVTTHSDIALLVLAICMQQRQSV